MCLKNVGHEKNQRGVGYKAVRRIHLSIEGSYKPYFTFFLKGGNGGTLVGFPEVPNHMKEMVIRTQISYYYNEFTRVRHKRLAKANNGQFYTAGIHLWLDEEYAKERFRVLKVSDDDPHLTLVKFRWSSPLARDGETIVVARAMPLNEISVEETQIPEEEGGE